MSRAKALLKKTDEAINMSKIAKQKQFKDSLEATTYIETLDDLIDNNAMDHWAEATGSDAENDLDVLKDAITDYLATLNTER